jgi:hypothetical protein
MEGRNFGFCDYHSDKKYEVLIVKWKVMLLIQHYCPKEQYKNKEMISVPDTRINLEYNEVFFGDKPCKYGVTL